MHLVLLLLIQVHAEWVEIYQQHYKKPLRPSYTYTALEKPVFERTTKGNRIYINNSLPELNWNIALHTVPNDDTRRNQYETSSASKHEIPEQKPTKIINLEDVEMRKKGINKPSKPVTVQHIKTADLINHDVPKKSNTVIVQSLKSSEATKYDDFEIRPLEVYNLSDMDLITEEYTATVINNKNVHSPLTTSAATIFNTPSEHSLITKIPNQELAKVTEQEFFGNDWPINEDRYKYVVQIVPSNSNKRRVDIVRNTVNPNVLKATSDFDFFESHKITNTWSPLSKHNLKIDTAISSFEKIAIVGDTTVTPKILLSSNPQNIRQKATTKATTTTIQPEPEIETEIIEGNKEQSQLIHLSTNINPKTKLKVDNYKIQSNSSFPTTDPDKVMIHEILKDQVMSSEITSQKFSQSNTGIIQKVYPTKIIKVDKTGHEIDGAVKLLSPTKATITNDELTVLQHNKENQDNKFYKIPYQANIKPASVITQKRFNKTKAIKEGIIKTHKTQNTQDLEAVTVSLNGDQIYKTFFKENNKPILKVTTKNTPTLTTAETNYNINIFDRDIETTDAGSYEKYITLQQKIPEFITKEENFNREEFDKSKVTDNENVNIHVQKHDDDINVNEMDAEDLETSVKYDEMVTDNPNKDKSEDEENNLETVDKDRKQNTLSNENKLSTLETLMKVLKIVTDTIKRNTKRNVNSKVQYLEDLQETISRSISK